MNSKQLAELINNSAFRGVAIERGEVMEINHLADLLDDATLRGMAFELIKLGEVSSAQWRVDQTYGSLLCYGKDVYISVEARPTYCDCGRVKVLVDWRSEANRKITISWQGLSRYYYSIQTCIKENEQWLFAMNQFVADLEVGVCKNLPPNTTTHKQEFHQISLEHIDGWAVSLTEGTLNDLSYRGKNCTCKVTSLTVQAGFVWRWLFDVEVDDDARENILHVDACDGFPRHYMSLENALSEAKRWLESRNQL